MILVQFGLYMSVFVHTQDCSRYTGLDKVAVLEGLPVRATRKDVVELLGKPDFEDGLFSRNTL